MSDRPSIPSGNAGAVAATSLLTALPTALPTVLMRGGTSKGVFVQEADLPPAGPARDRLVLGLLGSPDPMQLDGLGGTHSSTSKLMALSTPADTVAHDIDYLFAQVGIETPVVDWAGNCGNLTAAVAAYAVDEGYVKPVEPVTRVRMFNKNTRVTVIGQVPVVAGRARADGDFHMPGVPGTGAPLVTEYLDPAGAKTGALLPLGAPTHELHPDVGAAIVVSVVDVTGPVVFVRTADLDLAPDVAPATINGDPGLLARLESVRAAVAVQLGFTPDEATATRASAALPRVVLVAPAQEHRLGSGELVSRSSHDIVVRATSLQRAHHACPLTAALCTAAAATVPGTLVADLVGAANLPAPGVEPGAEGPVTVRLAHPKGVAEVGVTLRRRGPDVIVHSVSVIRTARRLMDGRAYLPPVPEPISPRKVPG